MTRNIGAGAEVARRAPDGERGSSLQALYLRPEFLIRRAHQLASAAFAEACKHLDLTPSQYAALFMLRQMGFASQNELGRLILLDRATTSVVLTSLRTRELIDDSPEPGDKRKKRLSLTDRGRLLVAEAERSSQATSDALLGALGSEKAKLLLSLLELLSDAAKPGADA